MATAAAAATDLKHPLLPSSTSSTTTTTTITTTDRVNHHHSRPRMLAIFAAVAAFLLLGTAQTYLLAASRCGGASKQLHQQNVQAASHGHPAPGAAVAAAGIQVQRRGLAPASKVARGLRRIALSETDERWLDESQILDLIRQKIHFMDVTDQDIESVSIDSGFLAAAVPTTPSFKSIVTPLANNVSIPTMTTWLTQLSTQFTTRYYKTASGARASDWIAAQAGAVAASAAAASSGRAVASVRQFNHTWGQPSIIARLEAAGTDKTVPVVILSAHMDSINQANPMTGVSPGADDDGTGSVSNYEVFRILVSTGFVPKRPIEIHWYSGEEAGLLGSQKVAADYAKNGVAVAGVLQMDMTGYFPAGKEEIFGIVTDNVDAKLTQFVRTLIDSYSDIKWKDTSCGYACSDHASWTKAGFPSAFPFETLLGDDNPFIHTKNDDLSHVSFAHVAKFCKLAVAFAVEMSLF
ncbi:hypothetical protein DFJ73DRAFT_825936 [Zopfochytrium polystomum]|nr:hypothetical protein DFJ73DRAFT_825936 [Zopfochytrium polystomum]